MTFVRPPARAQLILPPEDTPVAQQRNHALVQADAQNLKHGQPVDERVILTDSSGGRRTLILNTDGTLTTSALL